MRIDDSRGNVAVAFVGTVTVMFVAPVFVTTLSASPRPRVVDAVTARTVGSGEAGTVAQPCPPAPSLERYCPADPPVGRVIFNASAAACAVDTGFAVSAVLSTAERPTSDFARTTAPEREFTVVTPATDASPMYGSAVHAVVPSPPFALWVSVSMPSSPGRRTVFAAAHCAAVRRFSWNRPVFVTIGYPFPS
jgi:hypothetical protein